jgi:hypothetical protein
MAAVAVEDMAAVAVEDMAAVAVEDMAAVAAEALRVDMGTVKVAELPVGSHLGLFVNPR